MEYLVYYSNGEEGYLSHSGVKGMKWGVWNEETKARRAGRKELRSIRKDLRDRDSEMQALTRLRSNAYLKRNRFNDKAKTAEAKDNMQKYEKFKKKANIEDKKFKELDSETVQRGKDLVNKLSSLEKSGYTWSSRSTNFNQGLKAGLKYNKRGKELNKKYGKTNAFISENNAASGNLFTVKRTSDISDAKRRKMQARQTLNSYRPQRVDYYYY